MPPRFGTKKSAYERHVDELEPFVLKWREEHDGQNPTYNEIIEHSHIEGLCNSHAVGIAWRNLVNRWDERPENARKFTGGHS